MRNCYIILNYNSEKITLNLVQNILNFLDDDIICVVDNCSSNNSFDFLQSNLQFKNVFLIKTLSNGGYAKGNNFAIKYINHKFNDIDLFFICNPDVFIDKKNIDDIKSCFNKDSSIALCTCERTDINNRYNQRQTWTLPTLKSELLSCSLIYRRMIRKKVIYKFKNNSINFVDVIPGSFFAVKNNVIDDDKLFDENTFLYYEENILSYRLLRKGYKLAITSDSTYVHNHQSVPVNDVKKEMTKYSIYLKSKRYFFNSYITKSKFLHAINYIFTCYDYFAHYLWTLMKIMKK